MTEHHLYQTATISAKMTMVHRPSGVLPFRVIGDVSDWRCEHETSGLVRLDDYLERRVLSDEAFKRLLLGILEPMAAMDEYYLSPDKLELTAENIWMRPESEEVMLKYDPKHQDQTDDLNDRVKSLVRELIYEHVKLERGDAPIVSKCLTHMNMSGFHIKSLTYMIRDCETKQKDQLTETVESEKQWDSACRELAESDMNLMPKTAEGLSKLESPNEDEPTGMPFKLISLKTGAMVVCLILLIGLVVAIPAEGSQKVGGVMVLAALGIFASRNWKSRDVKSDSKDEITKNKCSHKKNAHTQISQGLVRQKKAKSEHKVQIRLNALAIKRDGAPKPDVVNERKTAQKSSGNLIESEGLPQMQMAQRVNRERKPGDVGNMFTYVQRQRDQEAAVEMTRVLSSQAGVSELVGAGDKRYALTGSKVIIGRQSGTADIVISDNSSIGRRHASLIQIESGYAVKDLSSVNGTFVNDQRLDPKQAIALRNGDVLRLSNETFTYVSQ